jgi:hypothetical protein
MLKETDHGPSPGTMLAGRRRIGGEASLSPEKLGEGKGAQSAGGSAEEGSAIEDGKVRVHSTCRKALSA